MGGKRTADFFLSVLGLVVLSPLIGAIALLVWLTHGSPVIFRQSRTGLNGQPFTMLKFRTMRHVVGVGGVSSPDSERLTGLGRALRTLSLDELPELWNVARGEMSLVGPRPLLVEYLPLYSAVQARRHLVRPGITGWAQVNGRNSISWDERLLLDSWYVDHVTMALDFRILVCTLSKVLRREGISAVGEATMSRFRGSNPPELPS